VTPSLPSHATLSVLIVDDEPVARQSIRILLTDDPDVTIAGECADGASALEAIRLSTPDLVFLDIQMPGMSGLEMLEHLSPDRFPAFIFTTAFDQYAVRAFEVHALDYLLKPFDDDRFHEAVGRAKEIVFGNKVEVMSRQLVDLVERNRLRKKPPGTPIPQGLERLMVKSTGRIDILDISTVDWIEADGNYVNVHANGKKHVIREKMITLETQLDPSVFVRIHRSTIVRADRIRKLKPLVNGDYHVTMSDGMEFTLSRTYRQKVLSVLG
jgi:two-component system LytT family response regulator